MKLRPSLELESGLYDGRLYLEPHGGQLKLTVDDANDTAVMYLDQAEQLALIRYLLGVDR